MQQPTGQNAKDIVLKDITENQLLKFIQHQLKDIFDVNNPLDKSQPLQLVRKAFYQLQINNPEYYFFDQSDSAVIKQEGDNLNLVQQLFNCVCDIKLGEIANEQFDLQAKIKGIFEKLENEKLFKESLRAICHEVTKKDASQELGLEFTAPLPEINYQAVLEKFKEFQIGFDLQLLSLTGNKFPAYEELLGLTQGKMPILVKFEDTGAQATDYDLVFTSESGELSFQRLDKNAVEKALTKNKVDLERIEKSIYISHLKNGKIYDVITLAPTFIFPAESYENKYEFFDGEGRAKKQEGDHLAPVQQLFNCVLEVNSQDAFNKDTTALEGLAQQILGTIPESEEILETSEINNTAHKLSSSVQLPEPVADNAQEEKKISPQPSITSNRTVDDLNDLLGDDLGHGDPVMFPEELFGEDEFNPAPQSFTENQYLQFIGGQLIDYIKFKKQHNLNYAFKAFYQLQNEHSETYLFFDQNGATVKQDGHAPHAGLFNYALELKNNEAVAITSIEVELDEISDDIDVGRMQAYLHDVQLPEGFIEVAHNDQAPIETEVRAQTSKVERQHNFETRKVEQRNTGMPSSGTDEKNPQARPTSLQPMSHRNEDLAPVPKAKKVAVKSIKPDFSLPAINQDLVCAFVYSQLLEVVPALKDSLEASKPKAPLPPPPSIETNTQPPIVELLPQSLEIQDSDQVLLPPVPLPASPAAFIPKAEIEARFKLVAQVFQHVQNNHPAGPRFFNAKNQPIQQIAEAGKELSLLQKLHNQTMAHLANVPDVLLNAQESQKLSKACGYNLFLKEIKSDETSDELLAWLLNERQDFPAVIKQSLSNQTVVFYVYGLSEEGKRQLVKQDGKAHLNLVRNSSKKIFVSPAENSELYNQITSSKAHTQSKFQTIPACLAEPTLGFIYSQLLEYVSTRNEMALDYAWTGFYKMQMEGLSNQHYHDFFKTGSMKEPVSQEGNNLTFVQQLFNFVYKLQQEKIHNANGSYNYANFESLKGFLDMNQRCILMPNSDQIERMKDQLLVLKSSFKGESFDNDKPLAKSGDFRDERNILKAISVHLKSANRAGSRGEREFHLGYAMQLFDQLQQFQNNPENHDLYFFEKIEDIDLSKILGNAIVLVRNSHSTQQGSKDTHSTAYFIKNQQFVMAGNNKLMITNVSLPNPKEIKREETGKLIVSQHEGKGGGNYSAELNKIKQNLLSQAGLLCQFFDDKNQPQQQVTKQVKLSAIQVLFNAALDVQSEPHNIEVRANLDWLLSRLFPDISLNDVVRELNRVVSPQTTTKEKTKALIAAAEMYRKADIDNMYFNQQGVPQRQKAGKGEKLTLEQEVFNSALELYHPAREEFEFSKDDLESLKKVIAKVRTEKSVLREILHVFHYFTVRNISNDKICKDKMTEIFALFEKYFPIFFKEKGVGIKQNGKHLSFAQELFNFCLALNHQVNNTPDLQADEEKLTRISSAANALREKGKLVVSDEMMRDHLLRFISGRLFVIAGLTPKRFQKIKNKDLRDIWKAFYLMQINSQTSNDKYYCFFDIENGNIPQKQEGENLTLVQELFNCVLQLLSEPKADLALLTNLRGILMKMQPGDGGDIDYLIDSGKDKKEEEILEYWDTREEFFEFKRKELQKPVLFLQRYIQDTLFPATPCPRFPDQNKSVSMQTQNESEKIKIHKQENTGAIGVAFLGMAENILQGLFDISYINVALLENLKGESPEERMSYFNAHQLLSRNDWTLPEVEAFLNTTRLDLAEVERAQHAWMNLFNENAIDGKSDWTFNEIKFYFMSHKTYQSQQEMLAKFVPLLREKALKNIDMESYKKDTVNDVLAAFMAYYQLKSKKSIQTEYYRLCAIYASCPAVRTYFDQLCAEVSEYGMTNQISRKLEVEWKGGLAGKFIEAAADYYVLASICVDLGFDVVDHKDERINRAVVVVKRSDFRGDLNSDHLITLLVNNKIIAPLMDGSQRYQLIVSIHELRNRLQKLVDDLLSGRFPKLKLTLAQINAMIDAQVLTRDSAKSPKFSQHFLDQPEVEKRKLLNIAFDAGSAFNKIEVNADHAESIESASCSVSLAEDFYELCERSRVSKINLKVVAEKPISHQDELRWVCEVSPVNQAQNRLVKHYKFYLMTGEDVNQSRESLEAALNQGHYGLPLLIKIEKDGQKIFYLYDKFTADSQNPELILLNHDKSRKDESKSDLSKAQQFDSIDFALADAWLSYSAHNKIYKEISSKISAHLRLKRQMPSKPSEDNRIEKQRGAPAKSVASTVLYFLQNAEVDRVLENNEPIPGATWTKTKPSPEKYIAEKPQNAIPGAYWPSIYDVGTRVANRTTYFRLAEPKSTDKHFIRADQVVLELLEKIKLGNADLVTSLEKALIDLFQKWNAIGVVSNMADVNESLRSAYSAYLRCSPAEKKTFGLANFNRNEVLGHYLTHVNEGLFPLTDGLIAAWLSAVSPEGFIVWEKDGNGEVKPCASSTQANSSNPAIHVLKTRDEKGNIVFKKFNAKKMEGDNALLEHAPVYSISDKSGVKCPQPPQTDQLTFRSWEWLEMKIRELLFYMTEHRNGYIALPEVDKYTREIKNTAAEIRGLIHHYVVSLKLLVREPRLAAPMFVHPKETYANYTDAQYFQRCIDEKIRPLSEIFLSLENLGWVGDAANPAITEARQKLNNISNVTGPYVCPFARKDLKIGSDRDWQCDTENDEKGDVVYANLKYRKLNVIIKIDEESDTIKIKYRILPINSSLNVRTGTDPLPAVVRAGSACTSISISSAVVSIPLGLMAALYLWERNGYAPQPQPEPQPGVEPEPMPPRIPLVPINPISPPSGGRTPAEVLEGYNIGFITAFFVTAVVVGAIIYYLVKPRIWQKVTSIREEQPQGEHFDIEPVPVIEEVIDIPEEIEELPEELVFEQKISPMVSGEEDSLVSDSDSPSAEEDEPVETRGNWSVNRGTNDMFKPNSALGGIPKGLMSDDRFPGQPNDSDFSALGFDLISNLDFTSTGFVPLSSSLGSSDLQSSIHTSTMTMGSDPTVTLTLNKKPTPQEKQEKKDRRKRWAGNPGMIVNLTEPKKPLKVVITADDSTQKMPFPVLKSSTVESNPQQGNSAQNLGMPSKKPSVRPSAAQKGSPAPTPLSSKPGVTTGGTDSSSRRNVRFGRGNLTSSFFTDESSAQRLPFPKRELQSSTLEAPTKGGRGVGGNPLAADPSLVPTGEDTSGKPMKVSHQHKPSALATAPKGNIAGKPMSARSQLDQQINGLQTALNEMKAGGKLNLTQAEMLLLDKVMSGLAMLMQQAELTQADLESAQLLLLQAEGLIKLDPLNSDVGVDGLLDAAKMLSDLLNGLLKLVPHCNVFPSISLKDKIPELGDDAAGVQHRYDQIRFNFVNLSSVEKDQFVRKNKDNLEKLDNLLGGAKLGLMDNLSGKPDILNSLFDKFEAEFNKKKLGDIMIGGLLNAASISQHNLAYRKPPVPERRPEGKPSADFGDFSLEPINDGSKSGSDSDTTSFSQRLGEEGKTPANILASGQGTFATANNPMYQTYTKGGDADLTRMRIAKKPTERTGLLTHEKGLDKGKKPVKPTTPVNLTHK